MRLRFELVTVFFVVISLLIAGLPLSTAIAACTSTDKPTAAEFMVSQGIGGSSGYSLLTRGKETLVKVFLTGPSTCALKVTNASLLVNISGTNYPGNTLFTSFASTPSLPTTIQPNSPADPVFVVPSANVAPTTTTDSFSATFTATVFFSRADGTTGQIAFPSTKTFERKTNALRVYVVPMGDGKQAYNTQYTATDQTIVQNAMQTLSRIYPTPAGVTDLTAPVAAGGVRYMVDTATMLDLSSISGAYVNGKFCGTTVNFSAIKGLLAQYLLTHNNANKRTPDAIADRVVGVVGGNGSAGPISWGPGEGPGGCADGMASVSSAESWIRLVNDQTGQPSRSGALAAMEVSHTFGLDLTPSYHSSSIQADSAVGSPVPGNDRAYNVTNRSRILYDHSVMNYNNTDSLWDNTSTLLERNDFSYLLCKLAPLNLTDSSCSPGKIGSSVGVQAGEKYIIAGATDGVDDTPAHTNVVEPYYELETYPTEEQTNSALRLIQLDTSGTTPTVLLNFGVPWSPAVSDHDVTTGDVGAITGGLRTFYAAAEGGFTALGAGEVRLVKVASDPADGNKDIEPRHERNSLAITLFSTLKPANPPTITSIAGAAMPPSGGTSTLFRTQITPRIPPKPDIIFLADTTGSMGGAIKNVRDNIGPGPDSIMQKVLDAQPNARFAAASYKDNLPDENASAYGCTTEDLYVFRIEQPLTTDTQAVKDAIADTPAGWQASGGCDEPEAQLNALYSLGVGNNVGYRDGSSRVVAWFGDAPGHDPSKGHNLQNAIDALKRGDTDKNGIRVIAVNVGSLDSAPFNPDDCKTATWVGPTDCSGQASKITHDTGGVLKTNSASEVANAILAGLQDLDATVTPWYDGYNPGLSSDQCKVSGVPGPLSVRFAPVDATVRGGTSVNFTETIKVAATNSPGTYTCRVYFKINGNIVKQGDADDPAYFQDISIVVGEQPQKEITVKATSDNPSGLVLDLIYQCATFNFVAAVAVKPDSVTATEATFKTNADTTNACAKFGGGGVLVPYVSDKWNRVGGVVKSDTSSAPKLPTAAIYSPSIGATINWDGTLALRGSGEVAGVELPGTALTWSIKAPNGTITVRPEHANSVDVPAPMPNGWTQGTWTVILRATDDTRTSAPAQVTFGAYYQFIGFLAPVMNPPLVNTGTAGKTFVLKWQLKSSGSLVSDLATVPPGGTQYESVSACDPTKATGQFAKTSGGSVLKYVDKDKQFVFNWQTPMTPGLYLFRLTLTDGSTHDACVNLTK